MSKRIYLPEIKRIITIANDFLTRDGKSIDKQIMRLPTPVCVEYELRYRLNDNGKYLATNGIAGESMKVYDAKSNDYIQMSCIIPENWQGRKFNRYVKVLQ